MVGARKKKILGRLPYVGLDIESVDGDSVRVEYSPNRPDFGADFGIARSLKGLLGREVGLPKYKTARSGVTVIVDRRLSQVRPFIACAVATDLTLNDEDIRQVISLQEDLHNGLGRKRRKVAIGLHDLAAVRPPLYYKAVPSTFNFTPLDSANAATIGEILSTTQEGRTYGASLKQGGPYPVIVDSAGTVLSFPPIINGNATKVSTKTRSIFVDVTSTESKAGAEVLAIVATTLAEAGGKLGSVSVRYSGKTVTTPDLRPVDLPFDLRLVNSVLGLQLSRKQAVDSLARSRIDVDGGKATAGRYRVDLLHPVDIVEEVALGFGVDRIGPVYPPSPQPGSFNRFEEYLDAAATVMAGSGMLEMMTYELVDEKSLYSNFGRLPTDGIPVQNPKSIEHSLLRDALIPTLLAALSSNVKADYPQRVFEIGRVYQRDGGGVKEKWHLAVLVAHSQAAYSEAKMHLEGFSRAMTGKEIKARTEEHWAFTPGRSAAVMVGGTELGHVGELKPEAIDASGIRVPMSGFEVDLAKMFELLK